MLGGPLERSGFPPPAGSFTPPRCGPFLLRRSQVSTILDADQIIVLDGGVVVGLGRHEELLAGCATYLEIVDSQLGAEERA